MLAQVVKILKTLYVHQVLMGQNCTVGELAKATKIPYSTVRRRLEMASKSKLVECDVVSYKSTGKRVFWLSESGLSWVADTKELM